MATNSWGCMLGLAWSWRDCGGDALSETIAAALGGHRACPATATNLRIRASRKQDPTAATGSWLRSQTCSDKLQPRILAEALRLQVGCELVVQVS